MKSSPCRGIHTDMLWQKTTFSTSATASVLIGCCQHAGNTVCLQRKRLWNLEEAESVRKGCMRSNNSKAEDRFVYLCRSAEILRLKSLNYWNFNISFCAKVPNHTLKTWFKFSKVLFQKWGNQEFFGLLSIWTLTCESFKHKKTPNSRMNRCCVCT